jgi:hypothetical protein
MTLELMPEFRFSCSFRNVAFWLVGLKLYPQVCLGRVWSASVIARAESLHGGADRIVREIAQMVGGKKKRARLRKLKVTNKDRMELSADSSVSSETCE